MLLESDEVYSNNGTKGNPCFQADIFGDWREEAAWRTADGNAIRIYTTTDLSDYRLYTLMHDTQYRTQVACEATGYNQPPTTSFYIGFDENLMNVPVPTLDIVNNRQGEVVEEPELNTDELKDAVSAAEGLDSSDYTAESWQALQEALAAAKDALANASTQEEIDAAFDALAGALEDLKPADGSGQTQDPSDTSDKDTQDKDTPDSGKAAQTGDDIPAIWSILAVMAAAVLVSGGVLAYRRKRG